MHSPAHSLPQLSPQSIATTSPDVSFPAPVLRPSTFKHQKQNVQTQPGACGKYLPRTDIYFDMQTNTITAMLELPGVAQKDIRISFGRDEATGEKQVVIRGRNYTLMPNGSSVDEEKVKALAEEGKGSFMWCERRCGEFRRVMVVPKETSVSGITF